MLPQDIFSSLLINHTLQHTWKYHWCSACQLEYLIHFPSDYLHAPTPMENMRQAWEPEGFLQSEISYCLYIYIFIIYIHNTHTGNLFLTKAKQTLSRWWLCQTLYFCLYPYCYQSLISLIQSYQSMKLLLRGITVNDFKQCY